MSSLEKIKLAVAIIQESDATNQHPVITKDAETNFLVDQMLHGWEDLITDEEREVYLAEANLV